ncbi:MAG: hypothetical protein EA390_06245 [Balneolaceae bacterium]|nr:MAG: hypothetical protein EA390_06245 [Balneolaceae bacterium]
MLSGTKNELVSSERIKTPQSQCNHSNWCMQALPSNQSGRINLNSFDLSSFPCNSLSPQAGAIRINRTPAIKVKGGDTITLLIDINITIPVINKDLFFHMDLL